MDLIIDGLIGYTLRGPPRGTAAQLIAWANARAAPTLSLDVLSGLDATHGPRTLSLKADATMPLALPKNGLSKEGAAALVGELYLADIGVPPSLYSAEHLDLDIGPVFAQSDILRLN